METFKSGSHLSHNFSARSILAQAERNTTLWIGHLDSDPTDHFGGQTFTCPDGGQLDNIQLYATSVQYPGEIHLTLHEFDVASKNWGPTIGQSTVTICKEDDHQWIRFILPTLELKKAATYGFRIHTNNAMVGIGEAA